MSVVTVERAPALSPANATSATAGARWRRNSTGALVAVRFGKDGTTRSSHGHVTRTSTPTSQRRLRPNAATRSVAASGPTARPNSPPTMNRDIVRPSRLRARLRVTAIAWGWKSVEPIPARKRPAAMPT